MVAGMPPTPRHSHAAVVYGKCGRVTCLRTVDSKSSPNGGAVSVDKSMYCFGGYDGSYRNDFHEFNFGMTAPRCSHSIDLH